MASSSEPFFDRFGFLTLFVADEDGMDAGVGVDAEDVDVDGVVVVVDADVAAAAGEASFCVASEDADVAVSTGLTSLGAVEPLFISS